MKRHMSVPLAGGALLVALIMSMTALGAQGDDPPTEATDGQTLRVATKALEPFVFIDEQPLRGFSIDYWNELAGRLGVETEWVEYETVADIIRAVEVGEADAAIAGISITSEREAVIDFSQPYYNSGLQIVTNSSSGGSTIGALFGLIASGTFLGPLAVLAVLIVIVSHLVWWFERGHNSDDFPMQYRSGIGEAVWWSTVSVITGGEAVKNINKSAARVIAIVWMLVGLFLLAFVTARATSVLTVAELQSDISGVDDLAGKDVGTVGGTTSVQFLSNSAGVEAIVFDSLDDALSDLVEGEIDAVVFDAPVVSFAIANNFKGRDLQLVGPVIGRDPYGIALPASSPNFDAINTAVIELGRDGTLDDLLEIWFG